MKDIRCHPSLLWIQMLTRKIIFDHIPQVPWIRILSDHKTTGFLISLIAETKKETVIRSFDFLPPLNFFAFSERLLSGSAC